MNEVESRFTVVIHHTVLEFRAFLSSANYTLMNNMIEEPHILKPTSLKCPWSLVLLICNIDSNHALHFAIYIQT